MTKNAMTLQRQIALRCVVDTLLGYEDPVDIGEGYEPILDDNYIREFARMMPVGRLWGGTSREQLHSCCYRLL